MGTLSNLVEPLHQRLKPDATINAVVYSTSSSAMAERPRDVCSSTVILCVKCRTLLWCACCSWFHLLPGYSREGDVAINHGWYQKTRVIALSCGIKISRVHSLVLSQSTRMTDRRTDRRTDGQNYDSHTRPG